MAGANAAWGIEIGSYAIKAIRLERDGNEAIVSDFAFIPHKKVLTTPDIDQNELIRLSLGQFISQKAVEGEPLVISIPGHAAFARFAKLPPVEPKKVPDIVKFEAVQQIPFPIDEVEWDYQVFASPDSPEIEVGIFAITRERVQQRLALYGELNITPEALTLSPVSVFNAMNFDHDLESRKMAVIYLDIGTNSSDLIVAREGNCWIRTFPLGGTHFTEAIANSFKLSYSKAEKLKHEAATSKYAKQIMQAMRPVFTDLLQDIQRSLGYYQSVHRDAELDTIIGLGSTFKIPGLRKFLGQQLQVNVVRLDEYRKIRVEGREAASFSESAVNMATAYGCALQGIGLAKIDINLVPVNILRDQIWRSKIKWFAAAAVIAIAGGAVTFWQPMSASSALPGDGPPTVRTTISQGKSIADDFRAIVERHNRVGHKAENMRSLLDYRTVWPFVIDDVAAALQSADPQPELLGDDLGAVLNVSPGERRLIELTRLDGRYVPPDGEEGRRQIDVRMRVVFTNADRGAFLNRTVESWLRSNAEPVGPRANVPYRIVPGSVSSNLGELRPLHTPPADQAAEDYRRAGAGGSGPGEPRRPDSPGGAGTGGDGGGGMGLPIGDDEQQGGDAPRRPQTPPRGPAFPGGGGGGSPPFPGGGGGGGAPPFPGGGGGGQQPGGGGGGQQPGGGGAGAPVGPPPGAGGEGDGRLSEIDLKTLDELAPMPQRPRLLPPNTPYFETEITFTIEIIDSKVDNQADRAVSRGEGQNDEAQS